MDTKFMTAKQLQFIRELFKDVAHLMNDESKKGFIDSMNTQKDTMTTKDASEVIDFLKSIRTKANLAKAKAMRANKA
jgi:hypothetical protein